jgi:1,4-alpha-glucan branching enzyme
MVRVWAPGARSVALVGDFNGWSAGAGDHLRKDEASGIWTGRIAGSRPRGAYRFLINGELQRRDPYGRAVSADERASLFYDPAAYRWRDLPRPDLALDETVIYEMHIGSFVNPRASEGGQGTFADAERRLDYLAELGVTTLCILPVHEFAGSHSWGYNPTDLFAVEQAYGGPDGLKAFVEACHARGLAVHLDIVHNHYGPDNLDLMHFDGTQRYFYEGAGIGMTPWGPRVRFDEPMVRRFISDNAIMWLDEYRVDGFRWDSTVNIRAYNDGRDPIPAGARMLETINDQIRTRFPGRWSIAEDSLGIGNFDGSWDYDFHHLVMPVLAAPNDAGRKIGPLAQALTRMPATMWRVVYVDNHDEAGKLNGQQRIASDIDPTDPGSDRARRLSGLGAVLTLTAPGIPLLFMGNEFLESGTWHEDTPLDWGKARRHAGSVELRKALIRLRRNLDGHSAGLRGRGVQVPVLDEERNMLVYWRSASTDPDDQVVVAINLQGEEQVLEIPFPTAGTWAMRLYTDWVEYGGEAPRSVSRPFTLPARARARTPMAPYSARIFSLVERAVPEPEAVKAEPAPPPVETEDEPFSIWDGLYVTGNFNGWDAAAWRMELVADQRWEGIFFVEGEAEPRFKITANGLEDVFWGRSSARLQPAEPLQVTLRKMTPEVVVPTRWQGLYRFAYDEARRVLDVERIGDDPLPEPEPVADAAPELVWREWTNARGQTLRAALVEASFEQPTAVVEREDGTRLELPIRTLIPADRAFIRDWIEAQSAP